MEERISSMTNALHGRSEYIGQDIHQETASRLMFSFIEKLQEIIKELEINGGVFEKLSSKSKDIFRRLESTIPTSLQHKITDKIKTPEKKQLDNLEDLKKKEQDKKKLKEKVEASTFAVEILKIFLPDTWTKIMIESAKIGKAPKTEETKKPSINEPTTDSTRTNAKHIDHNIEMERSYKIAYLQLTAIYTERLTTVKKAIEKTNGNIDLLDPNMKQEIQSLQNILPEDQRKTLSKFIDPESSTKVSTKALEDTQIIIAKQLAGVISGVMIECSEIIRNQGLDNFRGLEKPQSVSLAEIDTSHLRAIPNIKKPEQQKEAGLDMSYYERRSNDPNAK